MRSKVAVLLCAVALLAGCGGDGKSVQASVLGGLERRAAASGSGDAVDSVIGLAEAAAGLLPDFSGLPDSVGLDLPTVLHGRLTDGNGRSMSGATVLLSAWPSNETVRAMPIAGTFVTTPIAWTKADARGKYMLRSALRPALQALLGQDGLDVQLDVMHRGRQFTYLSQVVFDGGLGWLRSTVRGAIDQASRVASAPANAVDIAFGRGQGWNLPTALAREVADGREGPGSAAGPRPWPGGPPCLERKVASEEEMTTVASAVAQRGVTVDVTYAPGAQTEMSAGISYDGGVSFRSGGSRTRTSNLEFGYDSFSGGQKPASVKYLVQMEYLVLAHECLGNKPGEYRVRGYRINPTGPSSGFDNVASSKLPWKCSKVFPAGGRYAKTEQAEAYTYENAFGVSFRGASFAGSATSGYSKAVVVTFTFAKPGKGRQRSWCGDTGRPRDPEQRLQGLIR